MKNNSCAVKWSANLGTVIVDVVPQPGVPDTSAPNYESLKNAVLTAAEKAEIAGDAGVAFTITLNVVTAAPDAAAANDESYTVGATFDITIEKDMQVAGSSASGYPMNVTELSDKVRIVMDIPGELQKSGHTHAMVRVHSSATAVLADLDGSDSTITFETDRFSPYALVYKDPIDNGGPTLSDTPTTTTAASPQTGDRSNMGLWVVMLVVSAAVALASYIILFKRKEQ